MKTQPEVDSSKICPKCGKRILSEGMANALLSLNIPVLRLSSKYRCGNHWHVSSQLERSRPSDHRMRNAIQIE